MASDPRVALLGAYRMEPSDALFAEAMEMKYGTLELASEERSEAERAVRDELAGVVLFEVLVSDRDDRFKVNDFGQPGSDQAAYSEKYLSADGQEIIAEGYTVPEAEPLRMLFYLHFVDPALPLKTSYGQLMIPAVKPMPKRLQKLAPYEPVD